MGAVDCTHQLKNYSQICHSQIPQQKKSEVKVVFLK